MRVKTAAFSACYGTRLLLSLIASLSLALPVQAETFRIDDSGTIVSAPITSMRWRQLVPGRGADHTAEGELQVDVRLNLARWLHKPARIYMLLAPTAEASVRADWRSQGRLLPGSVLSGGRTLVYEGLVPASTLQETLQIRLSADGRQLSYTQPLSFYFEVEVLP
jgi:hypothetical protein